MLMGVIRSVRAAITSQISLIFFTFRFVSFLVVVVVVVVVWKWGGGGCYDMVLRLLMGVVMVVVVSVNEGFDG